MLTLSVYRGRSCLAGAPLPERPFVVRDTAQVTPPRSRLLDRVPVALRARRDSRRTEEACTYVLNRGRPPCGVQRTGCSPPDVAGRS